MRVSLRGLALRAAVAGLAALLAAVPARAAAPATTGTPTTTTGAGQDAPVVRTAYGPVRGETTGGLNIFRGIPYAAPPVKERRFKAPTTPKPWSQPLDATRFGPACPQTYSDLELPKGEPMSEDCLTLNVWSRSLTGKDPVIVFIHGGGFTSGTARDPWYDGAGLARRGATVVTLQYRIGPFGWLDLSKAGPEYAGSANNGLRDQMAALTWVRENIAAFGGDAHNITLSGESAGAISISALMGAPAADGLYDRAILQSGTPGTIATKKWAADVAATFTAKAGVDSPAKILTLDTEHILKAADKVYDSQFSDTAFHPVVDGKLIPQLPARRIASADGPDKPVIIGTTLDEARYWLYFLPQMSRLPRAYYQPWLNSLLGKRADAAYNAYKKERPGLTDAQIGMAMAGDVGFRMPAIRMAESLAARGVETRMYLATIPAIDLNGTMGSPHAVELPFVFGTTKAASTFVADNAANQHLSQQLQDLWVTFARGATPHTGTTTWPSYDTRHRATLILDTDLRAENDPYPRARRAWDGLSFDGSQPGLDRLTPLQYDGTNPYDLRVIGAVYGWGWIWAGAAVILAVLASLALLIRKLIRKLIRRTTAVSKIA
jgi:para-nitrobenzyl esterase